MGKVLSVLKKEPMLSVSLAAAVLSLFITPPSKALLYSIDWKTLAVLFMMLTVLEGFKKENIFKPVLAFSAKINVARKLGFFLVFCVFFASMFVTNDVSLIIFVPLTIILFKHSSTKHYIIPLLTFENIAAVRGSMLTPFGSPQNLFIFSQSGMSASSFIVHMLPLCVMSALLLCLFIVVLFRKDKDLCVQYDQEEQKDEWQDQRRGIRITYVVLLALVIWTIVSRTRYWPLMLVVVVGTLVVQDRKVFKSVDYVLILTFLCFFVFSSSIAANSTISAFLSKSVADHEYWWSILLSQVISNVPASIVLWPFSRNTWALLYGLDSAGLCSLIGSLASVINYRIYVREFPGEGMAFIKGFTKLSLYFFAIVVVPGYMLGIYFA